MLNLNNNGNQNNNLSSLNNNKNIINDGSNDNLSQYNKQGLDLKASNISGANIEEVGNNNNDNKTIENHNNIKTKNEIAKEVLGKYNNNIYSKIKLSSFTKSHIKALILYYIFYCNLEQEVKNSKKDIKSSECYLINKTWMNEFKKFYLYDKLVKIIQNIITKSNNDINSENIEETIYDNLDEEYIKEVNEKESKYNEFFEGKEKSHLDIQVMHDENKEMKYYSGFDILSVKVYDLIEKKSNSSFGLIKNDYLINDEKIIFLYEGILKPYFLVGYFDFKNHEYISEFILCYYYKNQSLNQYEYLKKIIIMN